MKKMLLLCLTLLPGLFCGCGYQLGNINHPQLKTVAVAPVENETIEFDLAAQVRSLLCERFMTDGSLKLVDESSADCIVYARVVAVDFSQIRWANTYDNEELFVPNEWRVNMTVEFSVIIPGRVTPLVAARQVSGTAEFETGPDLYIGRTNGLRQAAYDAAKNVVAAVVEGW